MAQVGQWVAERAQLPVEHRRDTAAGDIYDAVAEPVVAVDERGLSLDGHAFAQSQLHLVDQRRLVGGRVRPLTGPAAKLALDVAVAAGQIGQADLVEIDGVQVGEDVDQVERQLAAAGVVECGGRIVEVQDDAVDERGDGERRAVDGRVLADGERARDRHRRAAERLDEAVLARDVVRGGEDRAHRGPAQNEAPAGGVGHGEGEVRPAAGDQAVHKRRRRARDVRGEPRADPRAVDRLVRRVFTHFAAQARAEQPALRCNSYGTYCSMTFLAAVSERMSFEPSSIMAARASRNSFSTSISFVRP